MKMFRKRFVTALAALGAPLTPVWVRAADTYTLRLNVPTAQTSVMAYAGFQFGAGLERRSGGRLKVEVYPNSQLAKEQETIDSLSSGVIDLSVISSVFLTQILPRFLVFDMPFMFKDADAGYRVLNGPIMDEFAADLETRGILGLGWGTAGFKELETASKPVNLPEDMKGLRIRIANGPTYVAAYQALGAIPVSIDLSETYTALAQRTVDGLDLTLDSAVAAKYYNVVKHVAMLNHVCAVVALLGSKRKIEAMPADLQRMVKAEGRAVMPVWRAQTVRNSGDAVATMKKNGVAFNEVPYAPFRRAMDPVYAQFQTRLGGDLIDRVSRAANARG